MKRKSCVLNALAVGLLCSGMAQADYQVHYRVSGLTALSASAPAGASSISCKGNTCYALVAGEVWSVGWNYNGQLGRSDVCFGSTSCFSDQWGPTGLTGVTAVVAGRTNGVALKDGTVWTVGYNGYRALGRPLGPNSFSNMDPDWGATNMTGVTQVAAGEGHVLALKDGNVWAVGLNNVKQTGLSGSYIYDWTQTALSNITAIAAGAYHSLAIDTNGAIYGAGENSNGHLGIGSASTSAPWTLSTVTSGATAIAGGVEHSFAIVNGRVYATGQNTYGQLGINASGDRSTWSDTGLTASQVAAGYRHGYALKDGQVWGTGSNQFGQLNQNDLCHGSSSCMSTSWVDTGTSATEISTLSVSGLVLDNQTLKAIGRNAYGQLGLGDTTDRYTWTEVSDPFATP